MTQPLAVNSGSTAAIWPLKIVVVERAPVAPALISSSAAELQRVAVDLVALRVRQPHQRHVGQRQAVDDLDLEGQVAPGRIDRGTVDLDVDAGDMLL